MSRSGYNEDYDYDNEWSLIRYRGQVASAIRGKRGQALIRDLIEALDAMPEKRLIANEFWNGEACALGVVAQRKVNIDPMTVDPDDYTRLASLFGVAHQLIQEIEFENDEAMGRVSPERRWQHMRDWAAKNLKDDS